MASPSNAPGADATSMHPQPTLGSRLAVAVCVGLALVQVPVLALAGADRSRTWTAGAFALLSLVAGAGLRNRESWRVAIVGSLAVGAAANLTLHLASATPAFAPRTAVSSLAYGYAAVGVAALLTGLRLAPFASALLATASAAAGLVACEVALASLPEITMRAAGMRWIGALVPDTILGERYAPYANHQTLYPDNPRGYFEEPDATSRRWTLETQQGSVAELGFPSGRRGEMQVRLAKVPGRTDWHVQVSQAPVEFRAGRRYVVKFRARAGAPREIAVQASQAHPPWDNLGLYKRVTLDTVWRPFEVSFSATNSDANARLGFSLGMDAPAVELGDVELRELPAGTLIEAPVVAMYPVTYRMNGKGCRGRDYPERRRAQGWRILSLGDSFTLGVGVHERDTFSAQLERLLNDSVAGQKGYDVINCGVSGYGTRQERLLYQRIGPAYAPDVVLVTVVWNDDMSGRDEVTEGRGRYEELFGARRATQLLEKRAESVPRDYASVVRELLQLRDACAASGARLVVQVFQNGTRPEWDQLITAVTDGLKGSDVPVLNLGPVLMRHPWAKMVVHARYDAHPNEVAHGIAARELAAFLRAQDLLDRGAAVHRR